MTAPDDTKQRLLDAAGPVFAEKGFEKATVRDIIGRARVSNQAAVNYYFGDKEGLYRAIMENAFERRGQQMPMPEWPDDAPPRDKLRALIRTVMLHLCKPKHPWQMQLLMRELGSPSPAGKDFVRRFIRPVYEILWKILREMLPPEVSEEKLHLISFSIMGQGFYHRVNRNGLAQIVGEEEYGRFTLEQIADHIAEFSLEGVRGQGSGVSEEGEERRGGEGEEEAPKATKSVKPRAPSPSSLTPGP